MKYRYRIERVLLWSRWSLPSYSRNEDWTIIGIKQFWFSHERFEYALCFFGFELRIWIERKATD